jgi:Zn-dependent peptidase ImmA (M78 family)
VLEPPVSIEELVTEVGLASEIRDDPKQPTPGLSWLNQANGDWIISLNLKDHPIERAFVISHEVKHILDDGFGATLYRPVDIMTAEQRKEYVADYFAACLLMPRLWVERYWRNGDRNIESIAREFGVSSARMWLRLEALGLLDDAYDSHVRQRAA